MAGTAVAVPIASASQQPQFSATAPSVGFQAARSGPFTAEHGSRGPRPFHKPYQFRPRYPMNKGGEDDSGMYDGKRMRKAIHRKTVDYNPSVIKYIQNRVWQRDRRDEHRLQPDSLYSMDLVPPSALLEDPLNCVNTKFVRTSTNKFRCPIFCLTWTPEGRRLVTGASSGEFTLWNGLTFNFETILQAHETAVRAMRWSHSDGWMVTADHAGYIKYWQSNMNNVKMFQAHKEPIRSISFCPTDSKFASCSDDGTVRVWDFMRCHEERILRGHGADVRCVDWHPQKSLLASGSKDNQQPVKLWDPRTGNSLATIHAHKHTVMDLKWHKNGNWMLTASRDHLLKLFDIRNLKEELQTFKGHKREATAIGWHPIHEGLFASGSADGALMFWMVGCDLEVGGMEQAHEGMVWSLAWHPVGHILASGSNDHATKFWTRNRPGDEMRDKYNLNLLPMGMVDQDATDSAEAESAVPNLPGMGLEHGVAEHLQVKEEKDENELPSIPGLNWEEDSIFLKAEERAANKKVPYARPVPKIFEQAWSGEIDIEQIKKEQQEKQQQQQAKQAPTFSQPTLLLAQQMLGAALTGALRQQLAGLPGAQMLLRPGGPLMLGQPFMGPLQPTGSGSGGPMLLFPGGPGMPPRPQGLPQMMPGGGQQPQPGNNNSGPPEESGADNNKTSNNSTGLSTGGSSDDQNSQVEASKGSFKHPNSNTGDVPQKVSMEQGGPQASGPPQGTMQFDGSQSSTESQIRGPLAGQGVGPPKDEISSQLQSLRSGFPQGHKVGPPGPPQGQVGGPPEVPMSNPPQGPMGGTHPSHMGHPSQGPMGGPPPSQMSGPPQGHMTGPPQSQMSHLPPSHVGGPPQGPIGGPPQGPRGGPPQGPRGAPSQGPRAVAPQVQMGGPPQGPMGGVQMRRHPVPVGQQQGPRPQRLPFQGQGPPADYSRASESEQMDTDERYRPNIHRPQSSDMDQDFRGPPVYNGPAAAFSGEDQDLRQQGPPPPHHQQRFKPGPPRHPTTPAGQYEDYGDTDDRMGDTGDYDYRTEGPSRGARGRAPYRAGFASRRGGYSNYDSSNAGVEYDESGEYDNGQNWNYGDQGNGYNEEYYEDYNGYGEEAGYEETQERAAPPPPGRKRAWEDGPGQDRGRGRARGWGRGDAGDSWGRGQRGGFRGGRGGAARGGFRGRGVPWHRGPGGDRGGGRGRGGHRGGY